MVSKLVKLPARFESSAVDDDLILIDVDSGQFFALKDVGLRIWELLDDEADLGAIGNRLCEEYEVEPAHARTSVAKFAQSLVDAGFAEFR